MSRYNRSEALEKRRHPCIDCGQPCWDKSTRCRACFHQFTHIHWRGKQSPAWKGGKVWAAWGKQNPAWTGGKHKHEKGYILIRHKDHPRAKSNGYVYEHILVWENAHGKLPPPGWHIHHLNGIPWDNRPTNLVAIPAQKHYLVLEAKAKRIQELEALLKNQGHLC